MPQLVHLHVHTQYSILDGAASISSLVGRAKQYGMEALAITDHGNMFGAKEFYDTAVKQGIKPILGCETYVVHDHLVKNKDEERRYHLILLAKNEQGYHNLIKMVSIGYTEGSYYGKPRIDHALLEKYHEGVICCTACIAGELPRAILNNNMAEADEVIEWYKGIFGDDYYLEMQRHRTDDPTRPQDVYQKQEIVNKAIVKLAERHGVKYICTNDVHFTDADDAVAHDHLICLNTGKDLDDPTRMRYTGQEYFKSPDEMSELFADLPEAIVNTLEVADKVELYKLDHGPLMPNFAVPDSFELDQQGLRKSMLKKIEDESVAAELNAAESLYDYVAANPQLKEQLTVAEQFQYLSYLVYQGAKERYGELDDKLKERFEYELSTIEKMGFPGYFLIVWDYIRAAREMGVSVGPGRGSAAGSVVAYALKITNIDPIKYDLLFERFLNPDRISLPDVDVDFDEDGRADVLNYVVRKYGQKRVAQIITFGTMAPKLAIRDVARVQKLPLQESDRLAKLVPDKLEPNKGEKPFEYLFRAVPELSKERQSENRLVQNTLKYAEKLEGSIRQTGVHACGVIIGQDDLEKFAPIATAKDAELNVVQFEGKFVESVGLIKMDFLGLKTLSIIKDALSNIKRTTGKEIDIDHIALDDRKTYELFSHGDTTGVFQFESAGMKKYLRALKPSRLEDLIAMNALFRPGPMDKIPNFIARKMGTEAITYEFPEMEKYLSDTYGITVYQEQVMLLSQLLAGFTGGEADTLRKAMGKKKREVLDKMKPKFIAGAKERGHDEATCEKIWGEWEAFASYAFNKSHATCYAFVAYQTAYLKAHYPSEFMAAVLSRNLSNMDKLSNFTDECKKMHISVLGPDVNESVQTFSADSKGNIRFGLAGIKGVGESAVKEIVDRREEGGRFTDVYDFVERVNLQTVNRKSIENMALAGAFDSILGVHRSRLLAGEDQNAPAFLDVLLRYGQRIQSSRNDMQQSLFGGTTEDTTVQKPPIPVVNEWSKLETLNREHEMTGMFLSSHPLDDYSVAIKHLCNTQMTQFANLNDLKNKDFIAGGMVTSVSNLQTKEGKPYGRFKLEDYSGEHEFTLFSRDYEQFRQYLFDDYYLLLRGSVRSRTYRPDELEIKINSIQMLSEAQENLHEIVVTLSIDELTPDLTSRLSEQLGRSKGKSSLKIRLVDRLSGVSIGLFAKGRNVTITPKLIDFLEEQMITYTIL